MNFNSVLMFSSNGTLEDRIALCERGRSHGNGMRGSVGAIALNNSEYFLVLCSPNYRTE